MSNQQTLQEIVLIREGAQRTNASLITLTHLAADGRVELRDFVTLTRLLTGGNPELSSLIGYVQSVIAIVGAARTGLKLLQIEMGPVGWALIGLGAIAGTVAVDQMVRRSRY